MRDAVDFVVAVVCVFGFGFLASCAAICIMEPQMKHYPTWARVTAALVFAVVAGLLLFAAEAVWPL